MPIPVTVPNLFTSETIPITIKGSTIGKSPTHQSEMAIEINIEMPIAASPYDLFRMSFAGRTFDEALASAREVIKRDAVVDLIAEKIVEAIKFRLTNMEILINGRPHGKGPAEVPAKDHQGPEAGKVPEHLPPTETFEK